MECPNCNTNNHGNRTTCKECGADFTKRVVYYSKTEEQTGKKLEPEKRGLSVSNWIGLAVLGVIVLGGIGFVIGNFSSSVEDVSDVSVEERKENRPLSFSDAPIGMSNPPLKVLVTKVIDGDSIEVKLSDASYMDCPNCNYTDTVRLVGIDAPELRGSNQSYKGYSENIDEECLREAGQHAKDFVERYLLGKEVYLYPDPAFKSIGHRVSSDSDGASELLAFVEIDGYDVGESILSNGLALHLVAHGSELGLTTRGSNYNEIFQTRFVSEKGWHSCLSPDPVIKSWFRVE